MKKVTHLTSAHPRYDTRIFVKECCSLTKEYDVNLIVADSKGNEVKDGVNIYDVGKLSGRFNRMTKTASNVFLKAKELDSDVYHLHDPELMPIGLKLKKLGKKVIFDIHEDVKKQILAKSYLHSYLRKSIAFFYTQYEKYASAKFDYLVTPTPIMCSYFKGININSIEVRNYPILEELLSDTAWRDRSNAICHIGSLAKTRGISELVDSLAISKVTLLLGGNFRPQSYESEVMKSKGWKYVEFKGFLSRDEVKDVLSRAKIGVVTLHPTDSYLEAIPVKMFEYMAAGIAIIASDFPYYKELLREYKCAVFVNPLDKEQIATVTSALLANDTKTEQMGENAKKAVVQYFNWNNEEAKLFAMYAELI